MNQQPAPLPDDFPAWLAAQGHDAYVLAWVDEEGVPPGVGEGMLQVGESGIARVGADLSHIRLREVTRGRAEALSRWLRLEDGTRHLAVLSVQAGVLREHTPGELAADLMRDPVTDEARLTGQLADWFSRKHTDAAQGLELGWVAAATAWVCHMRALTGYPPPAVLSPSLQHTEEPKGPATDLIIGTALRVLDLLERAESIDRTRAELIEDWHAAESLTADVPALAPLADWLLDQIALRTAPAQQLRAVLEPDLADYRRDQQAAGALPGTTPPLDTQRATHLAQARHTVRAYTAALYAGREQEAQDLLDTFPIPARALSTSGPATAWRQHSTTAQDAVDALAAQRAATTAEDSFDFFADPELLHAETSYLAAREGQLHLIHDALGRLAFPPPVPRYLPLALVPVATAQTQRRLTEAYGTLERATQALDGQVSYQLQQPVPAHRRATTGTESDLLTRTRGALNDLTHGGAPFDAEDIKTRLHETMNRPATHELPSPHTPAAPATSHNQAHDQALAAGVGFLTPAIER
ncbi:hypothetical protein ACFYNX_27120 [Streptomyces sp. NPDC007872]|uniref:hypothetical protein n=1 Tax=Streptomyces sp. NPDC007872 TaxID=3364782 RepID=UPI003678AD19